MILRNNSPYQMPPSLFLLHSTTVAIMIADMHTIFVLFLLHQIVPTPEPREDLIVKAWPYDPEIPPMIFLTPNVTVPGK